MVDNVPKRPTKTETPLRLSEEDKYELEKNLFDTPENIANKNLF